MVVSAAFGELTEVLRRLESANVAVRNVEISEQFRGDRDEITANLTVGVPALDGVELGDEVVVEADQFDLQDGCVDVDLTVTLTVDGSEPASRSGRPHTGSSAGAASSNAVPAYKDPGALRDVYEKHDTFPEMTEALGADVTSETVRRYMVKYDIHDPADTGPDVRPEAVGESSGEATDSKQETAEATVADGETDAESESDEAGDERDLAAGSGRRPDEDATDGSTAASGRDETSVAELIATSDGEEGDGSLVADGLGIPGELTVAELATVVNESYTVHEVKRRLDIDQDHARRLLEETSLLDLVTQRLGAEQIEVSPGEVRRRIDRTSSPPPR